MEKKMLKKEGRSLSGQTKNSTCAEVQETIDEKNSVEGSKSPKKRPPKGAESGGFVSEENQDGEIIVSKNRHPDMERRKKRSAIQG